MGCYIPHERVEICKRPSIMSSLAYGRESEAAVVNFEVLIDRIFGRFIALENIHAYE